MNSSANIIVYFNGDIVTNMSEDVIFVCEKPACFLYSIHYVVCGA